MTERDPSTRTRPHACIDPSPLYLWPLDEALEMFPADIADSPQARRLAVLIAEAQAAGRNVAVLAWLCDAARVLLALHGPRPRPHHACERNRCRRSGSLS
jgi:hypothetical protein